MGWVPCGYAKLIENVNNVWMYGWNAGLNAELISDISGNVYCNGYRACESSAVTDVGGDVYGSGYHAFYNSNITNVNNSVIGFGCQSLQNAQIENATSVCHFFLQQNKRKKKHNYDTRALLKILHFQPKIQIFQKKKSKKQQHFRYSVME